MGDSALHSNTVGSENTAVGRSALLSNTSGSDIVAVGASAGQKITSADHVICIGHFGENVSNSCYIGHIFGATMDPAGALVGIDASEKLGTTASSRRFKCDIKPMENASDAIPALKPVAFHYKSDAKNTPCYGLIAEEVEKVDRDLVVRDKEGKPYSVRYDQINAMLLNEFLKEHHRNQQQEAC